MKIKIAIALTILFLSFGLTTHIVWAQSGALITQRAAKITATQTTELAKIQQRGATMIDQRITSLTKLLGRVNEDTKLTTDDKTLLSSDIQTVISALQTLKAKIQADTDTTTARADTKTIVTSYHIYVIFEPKERLLITIGNLTALANNVQKVTTNVQNYINTQNGKGFDTATWQAAVTDIQNKLADINTRLAADKALLTNLSLSNTDAAKTAFTTVRQDLATVRQDFAAIRADFAKIRAGVKADVKKSALSGTPVVQPSKAATTTPTP